MRRIMFIGLALTVVFAFRGVTASPSLAIDEMCEEAVGKGMWEDHSCTILTPGKKEIFVKIDLDKTTHIAGKLYCGETVFETGNYRDSACKDSEPGGKFILVRIPSDKWLSVGKEVKEAIESATDAELLIHHKLPSILGGGEIIVKCFDTFDGTENEGGLAKITKFLGPKSEESKIDCEISSSTNAICKAGELALVSALHLPWHTLLEMVGSEETVVDHFLSETGKVPGYAAECKSITIQCEGLDRAEFTENLSSGAMFEFLGELTATCSDGGTGKLTGHIEVLGFALS
jgi:hypothetical protein